MSFGALSGRAGVSVELTGRGETPAIEGRADISDLVAGGRAVEPIEASFRMAVSPGPDSRWEGTVRSSRVRWDQLAVENITASLAVDGRQIALVGGRARAGGVPIEARGVWEWAGSGRGHAAFGPVALGAITGVPPSLRLSGTGRATVDASVEHGVASASALAKVDELSAAGISLGTGQADVRLRGQALEGEMSFPARRLRAKAAGRLESGGVLASSFELDNLALAPLLRELGSAVADHVEGRVSSRGELSIPLGQPASGRGVVRLTPDGLRLLGEPWASQGPIVLRWEGPRFAVERLRLDGPAGSLSATGALVGPEKQGLSLTLDNARLPGALAELGRGAAQAEVRLEGGNLELTRLGAQWPGLVVAASGHAGDGAIGFTGRLDAELGRLGPPLGVTGIGGGATLTVDARGRGEAIEAAGTVRAGTASVPRRFGERRRAAAAMVPVHLARGEGPGEARDEPDLGRRERELEESVDGRVARPRGAGQGRGPRAGGAPRRPRNASALGPAGTRRARAWRRARRARPDRGAAPEPSRPRLSSSGRGRSASCAPRSTWTGRGSM